MKHSNTTAELADRPPAAIDSEVVVQFLRHLPQLGSADDPRDGSIIRRVEVDVLELIIRAKRRQLGVGA
ncbi:MAG: hypothetical protein K8R46_10925 [Pirellulales bacterium]|nr:hypothetical protein [Pirellulales bacterium]